MTNFKDFICSLFGCNEGYDALLKQLKACQSENKELVEQWLKLTEDMEQLRKLVPRPPPPDITYVVEKSGAWVQERLKAMGANIIHLPLDAKYYLTDKSNFLEIIAWDWVDSWEYRRDIFDCENFALAFQSHVARYFGLNQVGSVIDYKAGHGYNLVIFPDGKVMLIEPQADQLFYWEDKEAIYIFEGAYVIM